MTERIARIALMSVGYIILFTSISWLAAMVKGDTFTFDLVWDVFGAIMCAVATEFVPIPKKQER